MKKKLLIILAIVLGVIIVGGGVYWLYKANTPWKTYAFGLGDNKNLAIITYPAKYQNVSSNEALPDQKVGLFSIANVANFQLSNEAKDKDIQAYISEMKVLPLTEGESEGVDTPTIDTNYKTAKYGSNKVYFINEFNKSPDFVTGEIFNNKGHRLNFSYQTKNVKSSEIKAIIAKIKF